jgi:hypothetical protein
MPILVQCRPRTKIVIITNPVAAAAATRTEGPSQMGLEGGLQWNRVYQPISRTGWKSHRPNRRSTPTLKPWRLTGTPPLEPRRSPSSLGKKSEAAARAETKIRVIINYMIKIRREMYTRLTNNIGSLEKISRSLVQTLTPEVFPAALEANRTTLGVVRVAPVLFRVAQRAPQAQTLEVFPTALGVFLAAIGAIISGITMHAIIHLIQI